MKNRISFNIVVEDDLSASVVRRLCRETGRSIGDVRVAHGFGFIKKNINAFNKAARITPYLVLTDLDKGDCPASLWNEWTGSSDRNGNLLFRVAVREVESWLLGDAESLRSYLHVKKEVFWQNSDAINDPKSELLTLAFRSGKREIREAVVIKDDRRGLVQGPLYNPTLSGYVNREWNLAVAMTHSDSLKRAVYRLKTFKPE